MMSLLHGDWPHIRKVERLNKTFRSEQWCTRWRYSRHPFLPALQIATLGDLRERIPGLPQHPAKTRPGLTTQRECRHARDAVLVCADCLRAIRSTETCRASELRAEGGRLTVQSRHSLAAVLLPDF